MSYLVGSVGTDHHPFARFVDWLSIAQQTLSFDATIQCGSTPTTGFVIDAKLLDFLPSDDLMTEMLAADVVVSHGGPGTISLAMRCGHRPIVLARDPKLGEHVDDHQQRYVRRLAAEGRIDAPTSVEHLIDLIGRASRGQASGEGVADPVAAASKFGELMEQLVAGTLPRRHWRDRVLVRRSP